MFGVMPSWTDVCGAVLVLVTVISIPFENLINSKLCPINLVEENSKKDDDKKISKP